MHASNAKIWISYVARLIQKYKNQKTQNKIPSKLFEVLFLDVSTDSYAYKCFFI